MVNAVVLAGELDERLRNSYQAPSKGLLPLAGRPCLQYVMEALRATPEIARIALAGPAAVIDHPAGEMSDVKLTAESTIVEKLTAAAEAFGEDRKLMMVACDIPLVTPNSLGDVVRRCPADCAFFHPLVSRAAARRDFPEHRWVFIKLRESVVVTTNVILLDPGLLTSRPDLARMMEELRRHPTRMALQWGLGFLLKFKLGLLSLDYCERFFSDFLGAPCRGMICDHTDLAMDLDRPEDAPMLERALNARGR